MNDRELDLALVDLGTSRVQPTAPPMLRQRIGQMALPSKAEQGWRLPWTTQRIQTLFGAIKFVAAAAIVALFGGFLLTGFLMTQQGDDALPVGASPSPSPQTTEDVLSRLETDEVSPGVLKVLADGAGRDPSAVRSSIVRDDGSVWVATGGSIYDIAEPAPYSAHSGHGGWFLDLGADGTLWAASADPTGDCCEGEQRLPIRSFDGEAWTPLGPTARDPASEQHPTWPADYIVDFAVHPDGSLWQTPEEVGPNEWNSVQHLGPNGWVTEAIGSGLPSPEACTDCGGYGDWSVEITPDGTVWLGADRHGLMRQDGDGWEVVQLLGDERRYGVIGLAASRHGVLWAEVQADDTVEWGSARLGEGRFLARFDGEGWDLFSTPPDPDLLSAPDSEHLGPSGILAVGPDGTVWLTDSDPRAGPEAGRFPVSFDGVRWRRYPEILAHWMRDPRHDPTMRLLEMGRWHISVAPDGTAWANVDAIAGRKSHGGVYVIRPVAPGTPPDEMASAPQPAEPTFAVDEASVRSGEAALPAQLPDGVEWGTLDTPLGPARWVHLRGDDATLPDLVEAVPVSNGGYVTLDREGPSPRLWRSRTSSRGRRSHCRCRWRPRTADWRGPPTRCG